MRTTWAVLILKTVINTENSNISIYVRAYETIISTVSLMPPNCVNRCRK